jgi:hypothetical protein
LFTRKYEISKLEHADTLTDVAFPHVAHASFIVILAF